MKFLVAACVVLALAACASAPPAPVEDRSTSVPRDITLEADGRYRVKKGDSLWMIAFHFGLDHRELARWNDIPAPFVIYPGQMLSVEQPPARTVTQAGPSRPVTRTVPNPVENPVAEAAPAPAPPVKPPATVNSTVTAPANSSARQAAPEWQWPVKGRLLRGFLANNPARGGYDIAGTEGQKIVAAGAGRVVYSGSGLIGYGELIIIKHNDRLLSAYAHNRLRLVSEGDEVAGGQVIAEMGRNDRNEIILHFEIRENGRPVDPAAYLPKP